MVSNNSTRSSKTQKRKKKNTSQRWLNHLSKKNQYMLHLLMNLITVVPNLGIFIRGLWCSIILYITEVDLTQGFFFSWTRKVGRYWHIYLVDKTEHLYNFPKVLLWVKGINRFEFSRLLSNLLQIPHTEITFFPALIFS